LLFCDENTHPKKSNQIRITDTFNDACVTLFIELQTFHKGRRIKLQGSKSGIPVGLVIAYNCSLQFYKQQLQQILNNDQNTSDISAKLRFETTGGKDKVKYTYHVLHFR